MLSFFDKGRRKKALAVAVAAFTVMALAGCSKEQQAPQATLVKTMEVIKRDTPIVYDYTGFVQAPERSQFDGAGQWTDHRKVFPGW